MSMNVETSNVFTTVGYISLEENYKTILPRWKDKFMKCKGDK